MKPIDINGFRGQASALDSLLLPLGVGVASLNQRPGYDDLRPWNLPGAPVAAVTASPARRTLYHMAQGVPGDANYWLAWSTVVHAVPGFDPADTTERTYYTGDGAPKWTDNIMALTGGPPYPQVSRPLGVPAPTGAILAAVDTEGTGDEEAFSWVYTFVNDLGWESAPSPLSNSMLKAPGTTFDLSGFSAPPSGFGINRVRLYRFQSGVSTSGSYFFLREWAIGAEPTNPIDNGAAVSTDELETSGWRPCPGIENGGASNITEANAFGMTRLWNGMLAVLVGKSMRICEPETHYAWPLRYEVSLTDDPVAIGVFGQRALVLTKGDPVLVAGSSPDSMDDEPTKFGKACLSAQSVVSFNEGAGAKGVAWATDDGVAWLGEGQVPRILTDGVFDRDQWQALNPSSMVAVREGRFYLCFHLVAGVWRGFALDPQAPGSIYPVEVGYPAAYADPRTASVYVLDGANVRRWNAGTPMTASFTSKLVRLPSPMNIGAIEVIGKTWPVPVKLWVDGVLRFDRSLARGEVARPPADFMGDEVQVQASTTGRVIAVRLSRDPSDLREV